MITQISCPKWFVEVKDSSGKEYYVPTVEEYNDFRQRVCNHLEKLDQKIAALEDTDKKEEKNFKVTYLPMEVIGGGIVEGSTNVAFVRAHDYKDAQDQVLNSSYCRIVDVVVLK